MATITDRVSGPLNAEELDQLAALCDKLRDGE
jgi:hypothetical protein